MKNEQQLDRIQREQDYWAVHNFGQQTPDLPFLGIVEELGELAHARLKQAQGIRGTSEDHEEEAKDAVGDLLIFTIEFCNAMGWSASEILENTWAIVSKRDFRRFPKNGVSE